MLGCFSACGAELDLEGTRFASSSREGDKSRCIEANLNLGASKPLELEGQKVSQSGLAT